MDPSHYVHKYRQRMKYHFGVRREGYCIANTVLGISLGDWHAMRTMNHYTHI